MRYTLSRWSPYSFYFCYYSVRYENQICHSLSKQCFFIILIYICWTFLIFVYHQQISYILLLMHYHTYILIQEVCTSLPVLFFPSLSSLSISSHWNLILCTIFPCKNLMSELHLLAWLLCWSSSVYPHSSLISLVLPHCVHWFSPRLDVSGFWDRKYNFISWHCGMPFLSHRESQLNDGNPWWCRASGCSKISRCRPRFMGNCPVYIHLNCLKLLIKYSS